jgi:hypothetical protein
MKRYIRIYKEKTLFYFSSSDKKRLQLEINKIPSLRSFKLVWNIDFFVLNTSISITMKTKILKIFSKPESNVINGYYGCPVTGYAFGWK